jgi:hypothetical protein
MPFDILADVILGTALQRSGILPQLSATVTYNRPSSRSMPIPASSSSVTPPPAPYYPRLAQTTTDALFDFLEQRAPDHVRYNGMTYYETETREYYPNGSLKSLTSRRRIAGPSLEVWY